MRYLKKILLGIWLIIGILATCKYASVLIDDGGVVTETVTITKIVELPGHSFKRTFWLESMRMEDMKLLVVRQLLATL